MGTVLKIVFMAIFFSVDKLFVEELNRRIELRRFANIGKTKKLRQFTDLW